MVRTDDSLQALLGRLEHMLMNKLAPIPGTPLPGYLEQRLERSLQEWDVGGRRFRRSEDGMWRLTTAQASILGLEGDVPEIQVQVHKQERGRISKRFLVLDLVLRRLRSLLQTPLRPPPSRSQQAVAKNPKAHFQANLAAVPPTSVRQRLTQCFSTTADLKRVVVLMHLLEAPFPLWRPGQVDPLQAATLLRRLLALPWPMTKREGASLHARGVLNAVDALDCPPLLYPPWLQVLTHDMHEVSTRDLLTLIRTAAHELDEHRAVVAKEPGPAHEHTPTHLRPRPRSPALAPYHALDTDDVQGDPRPVGRSGLCPDFVLDVAGFSAKEFQALRATLLLWAAVRWLAGAAPAAAPPVAVRDVLAIGHVCQRLDPCMLECPWLMPYARRTLKSFLLDHLGFPPLPAGSRDARWSLEQLLRCADVASTHMRSLCAAAGVPPGGPALAFGAGRSSGQSDQHEPEAGGQEDEQVACLAWLWARLCNCWGQMAKRLVKAHSGDVSDAVATGLRLLRASDSLVQVFPEVDGFQACILEQMDNQLVRKYVAPRAHVEGQHNSWHLSADKYEQVHLVLREGAMRTVRCPNAQQLAVRHALAVCPNLPHIPGDRHDYVQLLSAVLAPCAIPVRGEAALAISAAASTYEDGEAGGEGEDGGPRARDDEPDVPELAMDLSRHAADFLRRTGPSGDHVSTVVKKFQALSVHAAMRGPGPRDAGGRLEGSLNLGSPGSPEAARAEACGSADVVGLAAASLLNELYGVGDGGEMARSGLRGLREFGLSLRTLLTARTDLPEDIVDVSQTQVLSPALDLAADALDIRSVSGREDAGSELAQSVFDSAESAGLALTHFAELGGPSLNPRARGGGLVCVIASAGLEDPSALYTLILGERGQTLSMNTVPEPLPGLRILQQQLYMAPELPTARLPNVVVEERAWAASSSDSRVELLRAAQDFPDWWSEQRTQGRQQPWASPVTSWTWKRRLNSFSTEGEIDGLRGIRGIAVTFADEFGDRVWWKRV